ncbi:unnamed protein product [Cladocopium goreaui]|uniref:Uncharacterized protein n=1 Tax=Cladocopium goreaui TaxID=2562237 RepID=A0A9P1FN56_9DINO|nr:unnamed protein product [Cladocopium goreaui]
MGKKLGKKSPAFKCHKKYFQQAKKTADVLVVENVPQYQSSTVEEELGEDWRVRYCVIDPRIVGLPAARSRIYLICYNKKVVRWRPDITLESVLGALTSRVITDASMYLWMELPPDTLSTSNLKEYNQNPRYKGKMFQDLNQLARNNRGRTELVDGALPTLTCSSGSIWSKEKSRFVAPLEMLSSQVLPVTSAHAKACMAPTFNVDQDEHPVRYLLETWEPGMLDPLCLWLDEILDSEAPFCPDLKSMVLPASATGQLSVPLLALAVQLPPEGLPVLTDWVRTGADIWYAGYEGWREPIETRIEKQDLFGSPMHHGCLVPTKGITRVSILQFAVIYSYKELQGKMDEAAKADFIRFLKTVQSIPCAILDLGGNTVSVYNFTRIQITEQHVERQRKNILQKCLIFTQRAHELLQDTGKFPEFRDAWMEVIAEYNQFGITHFSDRFQIDDAAAVALYGFKAISFGVGVCQDAWDMISKHLHRYRVAESAFGKETLNNGRWLVGAGPNSSGCNALWHSILTVDAEKQVLFLRRILFLHNRAVSRGGRASTIRLAVTERMCLMQYIIHEMKLARDHDGNAIFEPDTVEKVTKRCVDGDYTAELTEVLTLKNGNFQPHQLQLWTENVEKKSAPVENSFAAVDTKIEQLDRDARDSAFRQDCLKLTRDCAQLSLLYKQETKHERALRIQRVTHLKEQNVQGANFIRQFMLLNMRHVGGRTGELESAMDEFTHSINKLEKIQTGGLILWLDYTKYGRLSNNDLNDTLEIARSMLAKFPTRSCMLVICPHLTSEKVQNGLRGELRRIEDKLDALQIYSDMVTLRCTRVSLSWLPESSYVVPAPAKDAPPNSAETRSLSQMQESAQFLAGGQLPEQALGALLAKTKVKGIVGVVNLSPYDTWLETSAMKWGRKTNGEIVMPTLSLSKNLTVISYCERSAALQLMQDWKKGSHCMGSSAPKYDPQPPKVDDVDATQFPLQVIRLEPNPNEKTGWKRWRISLPQSFRQQWLDDVVYSQEWRELISDFDSKFGLASPGAESTAGSESSIQSVMPSRKPWEGEPKTIDERYLVETKLGGRTVGSTLYLVSARSRDGSQQQVVEGQSYKLFLAAHMQIEVPICEFQLGHGASKFLKPEKVAALQRENKPG